MATLLMRRALLALPAALGACASEPAPPPPAAAAPPRPDADAGPANRRPSGRVEIDQTQASFIGSVAWGRGTLYYEGRRYPLRVHGLGIGGFGLARSKAVGDVYGLNRLADFAGVYAQGRAGVVVGEAQLTGGMWLVNPAGVSLHLRPRRQGLALQLGADGMAIELS